MRVARPIPRVFLLVVAFSSTAAAPAGDPVVRARYLMGTRCEVRAFGEPERVAPALDAALDRIAELERVMTTFRADGELAQLNARFAEANAGAPVPISRELAAALDGALAWARETDGRFDPTIGALADAWGLRSGGRRPTEQEIESALARTSWRLIELDRERLTASAKTPGVAFDLGGFGKGYALDEAAAVLAARGVSDALLDLGGQVLALGAPPGEPGWIVEVAHPTDRSRAVLALRVRDLSVSTSGNAERGFVVDGERFGHLLDPATGRPVVFGGSVTVIAPEAAAADALTKALVVSGAFESRLPEGVEFLRLEPPRERGGAISARASRALGARVVESENVRWTWFDGNRHARSERVERKRCVECERGL